VEGSIFLYGSILREMLSSWHESQESVALDRTSSEVDTEIRISGE
jgi:hypothetical protein